MKTVLAALLILAAAPAAWAEEPTAAAPAPANTEPMTAPEEAPADAAAPAETPAAEPAPPAPPVEAAPAKPVDAAGLIAPPPAGKGQVVFFRKGGFVGAAIVYKVRENEAAYGTLSPGRYFVHVTDPGTHSYVVHSEAKDTLTLEVEEGETYWVEGTVAMGIMVGRPNLSPSTQAAFEAVSKKLKLAKPEPAAATTASN